MKSNLMNQNTCKQKHGGVAGLISIISILFVFSFATVALLQIESKQVSLASSISDKIEIQSLSASESISFSPNPVSCVLNISDEISFSFTNTWEENSQLDSVIITSRQDGIVTDVTGKFYVDDNVNKIISNTNMVDVKITIDTPLDITGSTHATFVTSLGNKFTMPFSCS